MCESRKVQEDRAYAALLDAPDAESHLEEFDAGVKGRGVRCVRPINVNELVCEYRGELLETTDALHREALSSGSYMFFFSVHDRGLWRGEWCLDATLTETGKGRLLNHSRLAPNLRPRLLYVPGTPPRIAFFATRNIAANEELLFDYGDDDHEAIAACPWLATS